jgi:uncharacterized protein (DUF1697 family)
MTRYVAFLRGINVGGHTVTMDRLREVFQGLGLGAVSTFIASGNVLFEAEQEAPQSLERRIEEALRQALGYEVATFVRSDAEIAEVAAYAPFPDAESRAGDTNHILFLQQAPDGAARGRVEALSNEDDRFRVHQRELYWLRRGRLSDTTIKDADLTRALGKAQVTARNANTVRRLAAKLWPA